MELISKLFGKRVTMRQCAALPIRRGAGGGLEVGLVTTRETKSWVIPKGWCEAGLPDEKTAALEAYEEAGLRGTVRPEPIGTFTYRKRLHLFASLNCEVDVYVLEVTEQLDDWPERAEREVAFMPPDAAAEKVREASLAAILRRLPRLIDRHH
ncbi:MAG: NUDIX hydrolase [Hyphomicrobiaceae bacterium]